MSDNKKPDAFEALVAEWIGEVGQLHQSISGLPKALNETLAPTLTLLKDAEIGLAKQINSMPDKTDMEFKRASSESLAILAEEIGSIASKIAGDAAAAERNKSFQIAIIVFSICSIFFFSAGFVIANHSLQLTTVAMFSLIAGIAGGFSIFYFLVMPFQQKRIEILTEKYQISPQETQSTIVKSNKKNYSLFDKINK
jgi:hypothetical protein